MDIVLDVDSSVHSHSSFEMDGYTWEIQKVSSKVVGVNRAIKVHSIFWKQSDVPLRAMNLWSSPRI